MKDSIINIVNNEKTITGFSPEQACFIGIVYGQSLLELKNNQTCISSDDTTTTNHTSNHASVENAVVLLRGEKVLFFNQLIKKMHIVTLRHLVTKKNLISQLNPVTAYSMGVHFGCKNYKKMSMNKSETMRNPGNVINFTPKYYE